MNAVLDIRNLSVALPSGGGMLPVLDGVSLHIGAGETVCLVGESGSGKTLTALSVMRLGDDKGAAITGGEIRLAGHDLAALSQARMRELRGHRIGFVFQEPMTAFDPLFTIGAQIAEVLVRHRRLGHAAAQDAAVAMLERVRIADPAKRAVQYPHELSGGMRQRAMIAMALACDPQLLIADEPTTALDVTIQAQILELLRDLQAQTGMAILLITHDLGVAAQMADRVAVIYAGRIVEDAPAARIFDRPAHPYTRALLQSSVDGRLPRGARLAAIPGMIPSPADAPPGCRFHPRCPRADLRCGVDAPPLHGIGPALVACWHPHDEALPTVPAQAVDPIAAAPIVAAQSRPNLLTAIALRRDYARGVAWLGRRTVTHAVDGVSLEIAQGETFGLVGESGCGKSTLARLLLRLDRPTGGRVLFDGADLAGLRGKALRRLRRDMQMVFQDPYGSIDPRCTVGDIVAEPLRAHLRLDAPGRRARIRALLEQVGLDPRWDGRYPHQLSGGQRQRVAIARAIALNPRFVLWDEAVSALDVSVQAQVINLLQDLKAQLGLTYLFIGHGLHLVRHVSDRIGVMYLGRLVEVGPADALFHAPAHPYTRALIDAIPTSDPGRRRCAAVLPGEMPSADRLPTGCRFHTRCAAATDRCRRDDPPLAPLGAGRAVACHFPL